MAKGVDYADRMCSTTVPSCSTGGQGPCRKATNPGVEEVVRSPMYQKFIRKNAKCEQISHAKTDQPLTYWVVGGGLSAGGAKVKNIVV